MEAIYDVWPYMLVGKQLGGLGGFPSPPWPSFCFYQLNLRSYSLNTEFIAYFNAVNLSDRRFLHPCCIRVAKTEDGSSGENGRWVRGGRGAPNNPQTAPQGHGQCTRALMQRHGVNISSRGRLMVHRCASNAVQARACMGVRAQHSAPPPPCTWNTTCN